MIHLEYQSMLTKESIKRILSKLQYEEQQWNIQRQQELQKGFLTIISKIDIRISTEPVIKADEYYYKIWIIKKRTKNRAHIKQYYTLDQLNKKPRPIPTLEDVLSMIMLNADVPDDFEEYCEINFMVPSDPVCRTDYLLDLKRAERFKKFLTIKEIRSIPIVNDRCDYDKLLYYDTDNENNNDNDSNSKPKIIDFKNIDNFNLLGFEIVWMSDKTEYDKLLDLKNALEYYEKVIKSYGFELEKEKKEESNKLNIKSFPVTKEDKQIKNIKNDVDNYNDTLTEYNNYLKHLIKKYKVKPTGNLVKRLAFNQNGDDNSKQQDFMFITAAVDLKDFS